jgi:predicted acetyltransferase
VSLNVRPLREEEQDLARDIHRRAFNIPLADVQRFPTPPLEDRRVAEEDGRLVGALRLHRFGQFFGGQRVPSIGIGGVAVAPEARGHRVAEHLVVETLREMRANGFAISSLYPATVPVYRRCGYEYAAVRVRYRAPLRHLPRNPSALAVEPWEESDLDEIAEVYRAFAETANGLLDRTRTWWTTRLLTTFDGSEVHGVSVLESGRVTGYAAYTQEGIHGQDWGFDLDFRDLVWTTPAAAEALLTFAARHRSVARDMIWTGSATDPLANLLPEQDAGHDSLFRPMARLIDVPAAIEARGYAPGLEAAVELRVDDDRLEWNAGGWRIEVSDGRAKVSPEAAAKARVDVAALAAMWTAMLSPHAARWLGRLDADDSTVATLEAMFAGPAPWLLDWF